MRYRIRYGQPALLITWLTILLSACSNGDDGADGNQGPPGPAIPGVTSEADALSVTIDTVKIDGPPVVSFSVVNQDGVRFVGLGDGNVRAILSKLIPGSDGEPDRWQSYINRVEAADGIGPGTEDTLQATAERDGLFENHGDGSYTYTFATDVTQVTDPVAVAYEPGLSHRLALQIETEDDVVANPIYDWRPSDGATTDIRQRDIVATASCNSCHSRLALHGGGRTETQYCVTCHNPGSRDANSGNSVDFSVMVHKIHRGATLPSVEAGGEYAIWGFRDRKHDYSEVIYPQDLRNCTQCHNGENAATPQGDNWQQNPNTQACGACHDDVNFATGENHGPTDLVADNSECTVCHSDGGFVGSVAESHQIPARIASARFDYRILDVTNTQPGQQPRVRFSIVDPGNDDATYDLGSDPAWTQIANRASRLFILFGWNTADHDNRGSGEHFGQPVSVDALAQATANGDGSYTVTSPVAVPVDVGGSGVVAIEGHPAGDFDGDGSYTDRVPVTSAVQYFPITDTEATPRRQVVDIANCNQCHGQLSLHGDNRTDNPQVCVICHNPNATDREVRPPDPATSLDGKVEESIDFKTMIHGIHAGSTRDNGLVVYGFRGSVHDFGHVGFPGVLSNCEACHAPGTQSLPLADTVLASTIDSGADATDPDDDLNITATAAVCSSCHDDDLAAEHMRLNGASFMTPQSMVDDGSFTETCAVCHGEGRLADVRLVHQQ